MSNIEASSDAPNAVKKVREKPAPLKSVYDEKNRFEIGVDEAGRGPLFGRLYVAATVLPKDTGFRHAEIKDSKKYTSKTKITELSDYIKKEAVAWSVRYIESDEIDRINILQAVLKAMHQCVDDCIQQLEKKGLCTFDSRDCLLIDGNQFKPFMRISEKGEWICMRHELVEGGDNLYTPIAAASILAKVARDAYIDDLCIQRPELAEKYRIDKNKGYGTKDHMAGIKTHGVVEGHRLSYKPCAQAKK
jgi:ribonuclease HII